jgi:hypothetical protein
MARPYREYLVSTHATKRILGIHWDARSSVQNPDETGAHDNHPPGESDGVSCPIRMENEGLIDASIRVIEDIARDVRHAG